MLFTNEKNIAGVVSYSHPMLDLSISEYSRRAALRGNSRRSGEREADEFHADD